jgi:hypothetical protein
VGAPFLDLAGHLRPRVLRDLGWPGFVQIVTFFLILLVGFVYVWRKGVLDWGSRKRSVQSRKAA